MTKQHYITLNSQFTIVLDGMILLFTSCSLLGLKMRFQVFSFANKKVQGVSSERKILMSLLSWLFHLQNAVSVFLNFNFYSRYFGKRALCPWNQPHFLRSFEDNNAKINASSDIPCTFLLFKASPVLQSFFLRNVLFPQVLRTPVFLSSTFLTFLYLWTYLFLYLS